VLVRMGGVVTRRTAVFPQLSQVKYDCGKCSYKLGPYIQTSDTEVSERKPPLIASCRNISLPPPQAMALGPTPAMVHLMGFEKC
jgi:DNA replicative helicase MCM subunit Mcm2 (Cdc46/Mcm family)